MLWNPREDDPLPALKAGELSANNMTVVWRHMKPRMMLSGSHSLRNIIHLEPQIWENQWLAESPASVRVFRMDGTLPKDLSYPELLQLARGLRGIKRVSR